MESKEREELIRRYCKLSAVPMPAILTTFAVPLVWLVLVMTDEIRFNSTGIYYPGLYVCLGLTAAMWKEGVDVSITGNSTNPTRFQHPVAGTYKKECWEKGKKYFSVASGGGTGRTLHPDNMA